MHCRDMWGLYRISDQCRVIGCTAVEERGYAGMTGTCRIIIVRLDAKKGGRKKVLGRRVKSNIT